MNISLDEIQGLDNEALGSLLLQKLRSASNQRARTKYQASHPKRRSRNKSTQNKNNSYRRRRRKMMERTFIGVDGEGAGDGQDHIYWLLRVGDHVLYHKDGSELQSLEILTWLADLGKEGICDNTIPISYYFDYDTTMILRHLPIRCFKELTTSPDTCLRSTCSHNRSVHFDSGPCTKCDCSKFVYPGNTIVWPDPDRTDKYIKISIRHRQLKVAWNDGKYITITDVADIFQSSFLTTIKLWQKQDDGPDLFTDDEIARIEYNKNRRGAFTIGFDQETLEYNAMECEMLCKIMTLFRQNCSENNLLPDNWTGPGRLAETVFRNVNLPTRDKLDIPALVAELAEYAYYGGRFEGIQFGES